MIGHEIGHPLYLEKNIQEKLLPIEIDPQSLAEASRKIRSRICTAEVFNGSSIEYGFDEKTVQRLVQSEVEKVVLKWFEELGADLFGLLLFGPAFVISFIHFISTVLLLDESSQTHPPSRLRLRTLFRLCEELFPSEDLFEPTRTFLSGWKTIACRVPDVENEDVDPVHTAALKTVSSQVEKLIGFVTSSLDGKLVYSQESYRFDCCKLPPLINAHIAPVQVLLGSEFLPASLVGVFNAGWQCYLTGLEGFKKTLDPRAVKEPADLCRKFNQFLLKSMELTDILATWVEVKNDPVD